MGALREAYAAGLDTYSSGARRQPLGLSDPVGEEGQQSRLRAMGKWRFVLIRGFLRFTLPMCLSEATYTLPRLLSDAHPFRGPLFSYLLYRAIGLVCLSAILGLVAGLVSWRRLNSEFWPGAESNPESSLITLGPL